MKLAMTTALDKLDQPKAQGETIDGLPCDLCRKKHTRVKSVEVEGELVWEIHNPCLDKIARKAVSIIG